MKCPPAKLLSVERIWDRAPHCAFTDLIRFEERLYCTFREGLDHVSGHPGKVRIIRGDSVSGWESVAVFEEEGNDLRDPKLSRTPAGRLLVVMGATRLVDGRTDGRVTKVSFSDDGGQVFGPLQTVEIDPVIRSPRDWLWRISWHAGMAIGAVYQTMGEEFRLQLVRSSDGVRFDHVTQLEVPGRPNETTLRFRPGGELIALVRRGGDSSTAWIGRSAPPYRDWNWVDLGMELGGPDFLILDDGRLLAAARHSDKGNHETRLFWLTPQGKVTLFQVLPSSGDTSYPGMVQDEGRLHVSYYSSHEERTSVYLATLGL